MPPSTDDGPAENQGPMPPQRAAPPVALPHRKILRFNDLAHCGEEVWIEYEGKLYRLQSTRQGKLILTK
ncbi:hemin uptake protein HemP [Rubripirellula tenax]|nr:hemin uptake protein HemP [Rubripirellula tenax]